MTLAEETLPGDLALALAGMRSPTDRRPASTPDTVEWGAASEIGADRPRNEDTWGQRHARTFVIADGMGGRPGGPAASAAAVTAVLDALDHPAVQSRADTRGPDWPRIVARADRAVAEAGRRRGHRRIGTTLVGLHHSSTRTHLVHVGDSRAYRWRDGTLDLLTDDHTVAHDLRRTGIAPDRVPAARGRLDALTGYLGGGDAWRRFDVRCVDIRAGDVVVLCTDGVHRHLDRTTWASALHDNAPTVAANALVSAARLAGARDDATSVVIRFGTPT